MKNCLVHFAESSRLRSRHSGRTRGSRKQCPRLLHLIAIVAATTAAAEPAPPARDIIAGVRLQQSAQQLNLSGQLRQDATVIPFRLVQNGPLIRYIFTKPDEVLQLRLGDNDSRLEEVTTAGTDRVTGVEFNRKVRNTSVTYEDLALKFLYWPSPKVTGEDSILTRSCWKIETHAPSRSSQYSSVNLWVEKASGALLKVDGYDWNGQLFKRFTVVSGQKIEGRWFLKQMRIEEFQPGTTKVLSRTYLEITR